VIGLPRHPASAALHTMTVQEELNRQHRHLNSCLLHNAEKEKKKNSLKLTADD